jgi:hypothetical protein
MEPVNEALRAVRKGRELYVKYREEEGGCVYGHQNSGQRCWLKRSDLLGTLVANGCVVVTLPAGQEWQNRFGGRHTEVEANPSSRRRTSGRYDRSVGTPQRVH